MRLNVVRLTILLPTRSMPMVMDGSMAGLIKEEL